MSTRTSKSKTEVNAQLLKSLLKLPGNKFCCDCKTGDHPRWASWNLGIFLCIRCSGIHRSMGTHISRVKSVDLDAWTDEQTQSMVMWGNAKANKYWEAKLDDNHVPAEGKIDNFVKTKYVSKRWTSAEERPDPEDLSDDEQSLPQVTSTKTIPDKKHIRSSPAAKVTESVPRQSSVPHTAPPPPVDSLLGLDFGAPPSTTQATSSTSDLMNASGARPAPLQTNLSLLSDTSAPARVTSPTVAPKNDLKMSIMSLYASAPKSNQTSQKSTFAQQNQLPGQSPYSGVSSQAGQSTGAFADLNDLFGGMNVSAAAAPQRSAYIAPLAAQQARHAPSQVGQQQQTGIRSTSTNNAQSWGNEDASWGDFQGNTQAQAASKQSSAFDDLYSTSDVWK